MERRIVCFDLGGVLVDICRTWSEACKLCGVPVKNADWLASEAICARRSLVADRYQRGELESGVYYASLADALDNLYTPAEVERVHRCWIKGEYPGVLALLDELGKHPEIRTACLSNTNAVHWALLTNAEEYPALEKLQYRFASHLLGCTKPDGRIFAMVQAQVEVQPQEILFFDDMASNITAAREAGWNAVRIDPNRSPVSQIRSHLSL